MIKMKLYIIIFTLVGYIFSEEPPKPPPDPPTVPLYQSSGSRATHSTFIQSAMEIILKDGVFEEEKQYIASKIPYYCPDRLSKKFNFSLNDQGTSHDDLLQIITKIFKLSPKPAHRYRLTKRIAGLDPLALAGDWMAVTMSNLVVTYYVSPVWTIMEIEMTKYLSKSIGWNRSGDGIPTSGCGAANSMALAVAMIQTKPQLRDIGTFSLKKKLIVIASKHSSTSWQTAVIYQGLGLKNLRLVDVDYNGQMDIEKLELELETIKNSTTEEAVMIVATAGTPVLGFIDPLDRIGEISKRYRIWYHVDAEKAGGYLFVNRNDSFRKRLDGIQYADSVTVGTWLFATPYTSSMLLTQNPNALQDTFGLHASYVFTGIELYNSSYDQGDHTIQTSRRPEIAKIWFAASRGESNTAKLFRRMEEQKATFIREIRKREGFIVFQPFPSSAHYWDGISPPLDIQVPMVSFFYSTKRMRGPDYYDREINEDLSELLIYIRRKLLTMGLIDLSYSTLPDHPKEQIHGFLTVSFTNIKHSIDDMHYILTQIENIAEFRFKEYEPSLPPSIKPIAHIEFPNFPFKGYYGNFLKNVFNLFLNTGLFFKRSEPMSKLTQPEDLKKIIDFSLPTTKTFNGIIEEFKKIINYSPHWGHPYFMYQLAAGLDPYALVADYIVPVLNTPMLTYMDSAMFMLMEQELVKQTLKRIYKTDKGDGIVTDGGSMSNQIPIALARYYLHKQNMRNRGHSFTRGKKFIIFTSMDAHYSTRKGAILEAVGQNHTVEIESNDIGQMNVDRLKEGIEKVIKDGDIPLMVVITTGSTIYGAIDPVDPIIDLCKEHNIWAHIDGMFGGMLFVSDRYIRSLRGIERSDSFGADVHKMMGSPMVCTIFVTRHENILKDTFGMNLQKYNQEEALIKYPNLNLVGRHWQMDKRNNIFKFWFLWKAKGRWGLEQHIDHTMKNTDYLVSELRRRKAEGFELIIDHFQVTNVCFLFIPSKLNPIITRGVEKYTSNWNRTIGEISFLIEKQLVKSGVVSFVAQHRHGVSGNTIKFLKFVLMGSALLTKDIDYILDSVKYYGNRVQLPSNRDAEDRGTSEFGSDPHIFDPFGSSPAIMGYKIWNQRNNEVTHSDRKVC